MAITVGNSNKSKQYAIAVGNIPNTPCTYDVFVSFASCNEAVLQRLLPCKGCSLVTRKSLQLKESDFILLLFVSIFYKCKMHVLKTIRPFNTAKLHFPNTTFKTTRIYTTARSTTTTTSPSPSTPPSPPRDCAAPRKTALPQRARAQTQ